MTDLKPCPFCGGSAESNELFAWCYGPSSGDAHGLIQMSKRAWNRRATDGQRAGVPEGWRIVRKDNGTFIIQSPSGDCACAFHDDESPLGEVVRQLCQSMLAAAPTPPDEAERDAARYHHVRAHGMPKQCPGGFYYGDGVLHPTAEAAIDAAIAASKGEKG